jgi:hypothetical protein
MPSSLRWGVRVAFAAVAIVVPAQMNAQDRDPAGGAQDSAMSAMHTAMTGHLADGPHMRMTALAAPQPGDAERAAAVVASLRAALATYADYHRALADGFAIFAPRLPQHIYHFTRARGALGRTLSFDPTQPTSLLYERSGDSTYRLVGAMYTAPHSASVAQLDARIPLSVAQWHEHINLCVPADRGDARQWAERDAGGQHLFGLRGTLDTEPACVAAGGRFIPHFYGWMIHVYPFAGDSAAIWGRGGADPEHM